LKCPSDAPTSRLTAREIAVALHTAGFLVARQSGSHIIYKNAAGRRVTVPFHAAKVLHPKVLTSILQDAGITPAQLASLM
jgi:predicted RNA binding protein YcfA (HicA-like mRNA interferase family)